jgi:hypothetical protein
MEFTEDNNSYTHIPAYQLNSKRESPKIMARFRTDRKQMSQNTPHFNDNIFIADFIFKLVK